MVIDSSGVIRNNDHYLSGVASGFVVSRLSELEKLKKRLQFVIPA
jgi:hypothetical protein